MPIVRPPRPAGQPITCSSTTNSSSRESPVMTSGMHQRGGETCGEPATSPETPEPRQREPREGAEQQSRGCGSGSDPERQQGGRDQRLIPPKRLIPPERESGPSRHQPGVVEAERGAGTRSAGTGRHSRDASQASRKPAAHSVSPLADAARSPRAQEKDDQHGRHRRRLRPVAVLEELRPEHAADRLRAAGRRAVRG